LLALDQSAEPFRGCSDVRSPGRQIHQINPAAFANATGGFAHVLVCFMATAAVANDQHSAIYFSHAAAPASANVSRAQ